MKIKRYGRRLSIVTGRLGIPWGLHVYATLLPKWHLLGISVTRDEDDEAVQIDVGALLVSVTVTPMRYLTKKELARRRDEFASNWGPQLVEEAERYLDDSR